MNFQFFLSAKPGIELELVSGDLRSSSWRPEDRIVQRFAMATLYYSTNVDTWIDGAGDGWFDKDEHECDWGMNDIYCST